MGRLELPSLATYASETYAYTNSATCPYHLRKLAGFLAKFSIAYRDGKFSYFNVTIR